MKMKVYNIYTLPDITYEMKRMALPLLQEYIKKLKINRRRANLDITLRGKIRNTDIKNGITLWTLWREL